MKWLGEKHANRRRPRKKDLRSFFLEKKNLRFFFSGRKIEDLSSRKKKKILDLSFPLRGIRQMKIFLSTHEMGR